MGLFNKKEKIPDIPISPSLPSLPPLPPIKEEAQKRDLPELPSFPANPKNENLNQRMVKSAVSEGPSSEEVGMSTIPENLQMPEEQKEGLMIPSKSPIQRLIPEPPKSIAPVSQKKMESSKPEIPTTTLKASRSSDEPIFIRIDKFQAAQKNFEDIKSKMIEIEFILKKIKDVKSREEDELKGWTEDIEKLKSRLVEVDSDIFNQL